MRSVCPGHLGHITSTALQAYSTDLGPDELAARVSWMLTLRHDLMNFVRERNMQAYITRRLPAEILLEITSCWSCLLQLHSRVESPAAHMGFSPASRHGQASENIKKTLSLSSEWPSSPLPSKPVLLQVNCLPLEIHVAPPCQDFALHLLDTCKLFLFSTDYCNIYQHFLIFFKFFPFICIACRCSCRHRLTASRGLPMTAALDFRLLSG